MSGVGQSGRLISVKVTSPMGAPVLLSTHSTSMKVTFKVLVLLS
jgi:hypothetical protein